MWSDLARSSCKIWKLKAINDWMKTVFGSNGDKWRRWFVLERVDRIDGPIGPLAALQTSWRLTVGVPYGNSLNAIFVPKIPLIPIMSAGRTIAFLRAWRRVAGLAFTAEQCGFGR